MNPAPWLRVFLCASLVLPGALFAATALENRAATIAAAERTIAAIAGTMRQHMEGQFVTYKLILADIDRMIRGMDWDEIAKSADLSARLRSLRADLPSAAGILIIAPDGRALAAAEQTVLGTTFRDRDYFIAFKSGGSEPYFVSPAYPGQSPARTQFDIARRRSAADGSFDGVIVLSIDTAAFEAFYQSLAGSGGAALAMNRVSGGLLARFPPPGPDDPLPTLPPGGQDATEGIVHEAGGSRRIWGFARLQAYPMILSYGMTADEILTGWRRAALIDGFLTAAASLALAGASLLAARGLRQMTEARRRLELVNRALEGEVATRARTQLDLAGRVKGMEAHAAGLAVEVGELRVLLRHSTEMGRLASDEHTRIEIAQRAENADLGRRLRERGDALREQVRERDRLAEVIDELARANATIKARGEEIEAFVQIVSHDLRTPLVTLRGFARELELSCDDLRREIEELHPSPTERARLDAIFSDDIATTLHFIGTSVSRFDRLIGGLLSLSRTGRLPFRMTVLDTAAIVTQSIETLRRLIDRSRALVTVLPLPPAWGDATAVEQIFTNLIDNAVKYTPPDREPRIEIGGKTSDTAVTFWVKDNGAGIPEPGMNRLFQIFQRFHPEAADGDGIGLAAVKRLVDRHGGTVWAESQPGNGTTFWFSLPLIEEALDTCTTLNLHPS